MEFAFRGGQWNYIRVYKDKAYWCRSSTNRPNVYTQECILELLNFIIDNIYAKVGDFVFRQAIGIPMGTDCAPFLANLYLYALEFEFMAKLQSEKRYSTLRKFRSCRRYIDDLFTVNNEDFFSRYAGEICPKSLVLNRENKENHVCSFLDLCIRIDDGHISTKIYDKRDDFPFTVRNFPHLSGEVPFRQSHGTFVSQIIRYTTACDKFEDVLTRSNLLIDKLLDQGFCLKLMRQCCRKFCNNYPDLVSKYNLSPSIFVQSIFNNTTRR